MIIASKHNTFFKLLSRRKIEPKDQIGISAFDHNRVGPFFFFFFSKKLQRMKRKCQNRVTGFPFQKSRFYFVLVEVHSGSFQLPNTQNFTN